MPPVNQGSRVALVSWTVVTSILAVVMTILTIYFYIDSSKADDRLRAQMATVGKVITPAVISAESEEIAKLEAARSDPARGLDPAMPLFKVALAERTQLSKLIGNEDDAAALAAAQTAMEKAKAAGAASESLVGTINALVGQVSALKTEAANNKKDSDESKAKLAQTLANTSAQITTMNTAMEQLRKDKDALLSQVQQTTQDQTKGFDETTADLRKQFATANDQVNQLNSQNADLGAQVKKLQTEIQGLQNKLGEKRVDPNRAVLQQADGRIIRVPGGGVVFIDLGTADHIMAGMTFEVYDKVEGIPPLGDPSNDNNLPAGKASILVDKVLPTGAQCHIVNQTPGQALSEGDLIANLVYDRYTKNNFVVYGSFDLDQKGVATPQDTEVIKQLITQWGGRVVNDINVDTDFVVLGKEPVVPDKPKEDDPVAVAKYNAALAEADEYASISAKAREYRLPILNQNRFLYMCGYYEQAKR